MTVQELYDSSVVSLQKAIAYSKGSQSQAYHRPHQKTYSLRGPQDCSFTRPRYGLSGPHFEKLAYSKQSGLFPITRPEGWRVAERTARLRRENAAELRHIQQGKLQPTPQMISHVNRTFDHGLVDKYTDEEWEDPFALPKLRTLKKLRSPGSGVDPADPMFAQSKWLYDTPGVITPDQLNILLLDGSSSHATYRRVVPPRILLQWEWQLLLIGQTLSSGRGPALFTKSLTGAPVKASSQLVSGKRPKARNIIQSQQGCPTGCRAIRRFKVHAITVACGRRAECQS
ncbi:nitric oxide associated protein 1 [Homalodisca vitripennis]|nr:nitric oxide associated protein 1 [Homalodisca vitripennis]